MHTTKHDGRTRDRKRSRHSRDVALHRRTVRAIKYRETTLDALGVEA